MKEWRRSGREKQPGRIYIEFCIWLLAVLIGFAGILLFLASPASGQRTVEFPQTSTMLSFPICEGARRHTCVVDGDTFWLDGEKIRILDIDTPEVSEPRCQTEADLERRATVRLAELLGSGSISLRRSGDDRDRYGRLLRVVMVDGRSVGDRLVREGLARTWTGRREPWC